MAQNSFLEFRVRGHLVEILRKVRFGEKGLAIRSLTFPKHAPFVRELMTAPDTRRQLLSNVTEDIAAVLEAASTL